MSNQNHSFSDPRPLEASIGVPVSQIKSAALNVLVLTNLRTSRLSVRPDGPLAVEAVGTWDEVSALTANTRFDVLVIEEPTEGQLESENLSDLQGNLPDLHVAIFGEDISEPMARLALRKGVNGIFLALPDAAPMDNPLRMVAEGTLYVDGPLSGLLMEEHTDPMGDDHPVISLTDTVALVADDDEYFRMALTRILLDEFGFAEVLEACNLDQAHQMLSGCDRVDLALFDLAMPGMDGPASLQPLRHRHPGIRKLAVVSGSQDRNHVLDSLAIGSHGFVSKLEGIPELKLALAQMLKGRIYAPSLLQEPPVRMSTDASPAATPVVADPNVTLSFETEGLSGMDTALDPEHVAEASRYVPEAKDQQEDSATAQDVEPDLSPRQRRVLELLVQGMSNKEIARELDLGIGTVKVHMTALFAKLGVSNRTSAVAVGARWL